MVGTRITGHEPVVELHVQNWVNNQIHDQLTRFRDEVTLTIQNAIATALSGPVVDTLRRNGEGTSRETQQQFTRMTMIEFSKFGGEDVRGWLYKCEQFFEIDHVVDPYKVQLASKHLYDTASLWHRQFVKLMGENASWNSYKEAIMLRVGNVDDLVINDSYCEVELEKNECAHKMFDEKPIKGTVKHDTIAESILVNAHTGFHTKGNI
ncbi:hypothetical protein Tco_1163542 [Tanacetum coccineum]